MLATTRAVSRYPLLIYTRLSLLPPRSPHLSPRGYCSAATSQKAERPVFIVTDRCAEKINEIKEQDKNENLKLRVAVDSGGCSGYKYAWNMEEEDVDPEEDYIYERNGAQVVVDKRSMDLIKGSRIDFAKELIGEKFKILDNPQSGKSCGCGTSFNIKE